MVNVRLLSVEFALKQETYMKTTLKAALGFSTALMMAGAAHAGPTDKTMTAKDAKAAEQTHTVVRTIDADGRVGQLTLFQVQDNPQQTAVLGALAEQTTDAYVVQDNEGDIYINHVVPSEDLLDTTLMVETVDTYQITHRGMTFTNKIVTDER
jgi:hypothetical protein